jgi:hypothetical protein
LDEEQSRAFYDPRGITDASLVELALQLLAAQCVVVHEQHTQQQQQQQGTLGRQSQRLTKQLRGDRLLLPDPRQWLAELLPSDAFIDAARECGTQGAPYCSEGSDAWQVSTIAALWRHLRAFCSSDSSSSSSRSSGYINISNSQVLSAAAIAVPAHVLLQAAVHWQRRCYSLTAEQQQLLAAVAEIGVSAGQAAASRSAQAQLVHPSMLLELCCHLLVLQLRQLRASKQVGKLLLLVKQAGQQLLQGMTLALQCGRLDARSAETASDLLLGALLLLDGASKCAMRNECVPAHAMHK